MSSSNGVYKMPQPQIGTMVWFLANPLETPCEPVPAVVAKVGDRGLNLAIIYPNMLNMGSADGIRHVSDPDLKRPEIASDGAWMEIPAQPSPVGMHIIDRLTVLEELFAGTPKPKK